MRFHEPEMDETRGALVDRSAPFPSAVDRCMLCFDGEHRFSRAGSRQLYVPSTAWGCGDHHVADGQLAPVYAPAMDSQPIASNV